MLHPIGQLLIYFGLSYIGLGRVSVVKTVHSPVIISVSLHHRQCDSLCEIWHGNTKWPRSIIDVCCFTVILSSWAPCKCVYWTLLMVRGQCPLWFWWLFCLWIWPTLNIIIIIIFRGPSWILAEWNLYTGTCCILALWWWCICCGPDDERILDVVPREDGARNSG